MTRSKWVGKPDYLLGCTVFVTIPIFLVTYDLCAEYLVERDRYWKQKTLVTEDRPVCKEVIEKYHRDEQRRTFSRKAHGNQMRFENKSIDADRKQIIVCIDSLASGGNQCIIPNPKLGYSCPAHRPVNILL